MFGLLVLSMTPRECISLTRWQNFDLLEISLENQLHQLSRKVISDIADACSKGGKKLAFHAPSADIVLGSMNDGIRKESMRQIRCAITKVGPYAEFITIHTGFMPRFSPKGTLERCVTSLRSLAKMAEENGTILAIENVYEETTNQLLDYLWLVDPHPLKLTFDVAHALIYSDMAINVTFHALSKYLIDVHLSRPEGKRDSHLPLNLKWNALQDVLSAAVEASYTGTLTVEALNLSDTKKGLEVLHIMHSQLTQSKIR